MPKPNLRALEGLTGLRISVDKNKFENVKREIDRMRAAPAKNFEGYNVSEMF